MEYTGYNVNYENQTKIQYKIFYLKQEKKKKKKKIIIIMITFSSILGQKISENKKLFQNNIKLIQDLFQQFRQKKDQITEILTVKLQSFKGAIKQYTNIIEQIDNQYPEFENKKSDLVFDCISKYFISEIHYISSLQYDIRNIVSKLKDEEGKEKIKLEKIILQNEYNSSVLSSIIKSNSLSQKTNSFFSENEAANKIKSRAMDFFNKYKKEKEGIIQFQNGDLDGQLACTWNLILSEQKNMESLNKEQ
ncbi:hypothetical protein IMG5_113380 [Ichthyophthirius multifiliis]|uniref:Uncharacterized protein n=1 Tax=Ichthyophthirius multifiliis TaxID=5932 RepID=G0QTZ7_ICHMU|nr:hypothetical protein IMG5_113380 [Ichthyophthirius multifiliis]EGR31301.1 hypothetical protein IMG5_113380 [Ichthyophthirius multifiliis]|eukprot:XP_004034787.1 hypothetical protein IMG5_113380 [Ichthyophthirius multifiliis]